MKSTLIWDEHEIQKNHIECISEDSDISFDDAGAQCSQDPYYFTDILEFEWECLVDNLTEIIENINPNYCWYVEAKNFGWRNINGYTQFYADNGKDFLQKILPDTNCTFYIFVDDDKIRIQNYHHDSLTGNEWYYCYPSFQCEECYSDRPRDDTITDSNGFNYCTDCVWEYIEEFLTQ